MRRPLAFFVAGVVCAGLAALLGAIVVIEGGLFDATASTPHNPVVALATHRAMIQSVRVRAGVSNGALRLSAREVAAGFADYDGACSQCHGGPGLARAAWAQGMTPTPPYLSDAARRWTPAQLYWIVGQGVKMTGMPAWVETRTPAQLWRLVAFLEALPYLTADDYRRMRAAERARRLGQDRTAGAP